MPEHEASEEPSTAITRNLVTWLLGTPDRIDGSLNDPREQIEAGVRFNERWWYDNLAHDPAGARARVVYWLRYDFAGSAVLEAGSWRRDGKLEKALHRQSSVAAQSEHQEPLPARYRVNHHNRAITPSNVYRPVSEFSGKPDLGGYVQRRLPDS